MTSPSGTSFVAPDDSYFEQFPDEFCLTWFPHNDCSYTLDEKKINEKLKNDCGYVLTRSLLRCEIIAAGYLRQNNINPKDISTILGKYLSQPNVKLNIHNDHKSCIILFPSMKQVCINIFQNFNKFHKCDGIQHPKFYDMRCGIVGFPKNDIYNKKTKNLQTFYNLLNKYDRQLQSFPCEVDFCDLFYMFEYIVHRMEKTPNVQAKGRWQPQNKDEMKTFTCEMEIIDCAVMRDLENDSVHCRIEYLGKKSEHKWKAITATIPLDISKEMHSGLIKMIALF